MYLFAGYVLAPGGCIYFVCALPPSGCWAVVSQYSSFEIVWILAT